MHRTTQVETAAAPDKSASCNVATRREINLILISLMAIPSSFGLVDIIKTSGSYIGRQKGDIGYNAFIGRPKPPHDGPGRDLILKRWNELSRDNRIAVIARALYPHEGEPIDLKTEFGIPIDQLD